MNSAIPFQDSLFLATNNILAQFVAFIPTLIGALIILILGILLGKLAKSLTISFLGAINLSGLIKNSSLDQFLSKAEIRPKIEEILGETVRWLILYIFIIAAVNAVGLTTVGDFLTSILSYVPQVIAALLILAVGVIIAGLTESIVKSAISGFDIATARLAGKVSSYIVVIIAALIAISELGIAETFINILFIGFVATLAIGLGLAFGMGSKDLVAKVLNNWYRQIEKTTKKNSKKS